MEEIKSLAQVSRIIALNSCIHEGYWEDCVSFGVDIREWAENSRDRLLLEKWISAKEKGASHSAALRFVAPDLKALAEVWPEFDYRYPSDFVKLKYPEAIDQRRVEELKFQLEMNPLQAKEHIARYLDRACTGVVLEQPHFSMERDLDEIEKKQAAAALVQQIPDWELLSEAIGGFNPGRVGILMAGTGKGKTLVGLNLAVGSSQRMKTLYLNMEMIPEDIKLRLYMQTSQTNFSDFYKNRARIDRAAVREKVSPNLFISDGKTLALDQIKAVIRREKPSFVVVDYDQKIDVRTSRETPEWKALQLAIESLEEISKSERCCILVLAQEAKEENNLSGSRRSSFPASFVLRLFDQGGVWYLAATFKNRFGPLGKGVRLEYKPECAFVREQELLNVFDIKREKTSV